jgi:uncharacterized membrane protein YuzA (DUF378 family)
MQTLFWITFILVVVGGLNWLLVGLAKFDLVRALFPPENKAAFAYSAVSRAVYVLVGVAAVFQLFYVLSTKG